MSGFLEEPNQTCLPAKRGILRIVPHRDESVRRKCRRRDFSATRVICAFLACMMLHTGVVAARELAITIDDLPRGVMAHNAILKRSSQ
jgi:hypothetical protein